ncbi:hypothetical protein ODS41_03670 [Pyrobaculum sp. 3827-6]|uniref:hypothetical protein n=1 Tax=Pyrobaculum sp. 3827-6 TaxID=2983604 RepID=UPI0021D8EBE6|nr:hypothetical protein [Pyrobaculum sp. 3827-6]MCU7787026.1 hypothetical protein [Pyrobaculum sp. 3827-6]
MYRGLVIGVVSALVLAAAFATWGEGAKVSEIASTGYIDADFKDVQISLKDSYVEVSYYLAGSDPGNDGPPTWYITVSNMYPNARATLNARLYNDGTLPIKITNCNFTSIPGGFEFKDIDFDFDVQIDVDVHRDTPAARGSRAIILKPGERLYVVVYLRGRPDAREGVSATVAFTCTYKQAT